MTNIIKVGMADAAIAVAPSRIRTCGLGSCVGVTLYDPHVKVGGMAHVMLPTSSMSRETTLNRAKYADSALSLLIEQINQRGAKLARLQAKLAGGAQMFAFAQATEAMRIGPRNVQACKQMLRHYNIDIIAEDTGGNWGRTIELETTTGALHIRSVNKGMKII